ncbi:tetratricopeptide repeat protein, partial [bacterium]|nr:tetratricopeptide repeat protein [bacterium]
MDQAPCGQPTIHCPAVTFGETMLRFLSSSFFLLLLLTNPLHADEIDTLLAKADSLFAAEQYTLSAEAAEEAVALLEERTTPDTERLYEALSDAGMGYYYGSDMKKGREYLERALTVAQQRDDPEAIASTRGAIAEIKIYTGQYREALADFEEVEPIWRARENDFELGTNLNNQGTAHYYLGDIANALKYFELALDRFYAAEKPDEVVAVENNLTAIYEATHQYDRALEILERAHAYNVEHGWPERAGMNLVNIGGIYENLGRYEEALEVHGDALATFEEQGFVPNQVLARLRIGRTLEQLARYRQASQVYENALETAREQEMAVETSILLGNLGTLHFDWGRFEEGREYYEEALRMGRELGLREHTMVRLGNLAAHHARMGTYDEADSLFQASLQIAREDSLVKRIAWTYSNLGSMRADQGRYEEALDLLQRSLEIDSTLGHTAELATRLNNIGTVFKDMGNYERAAQY